MIQTCDGYLQNWYPKCFVNTYHRKLLTRKKHLATHKIKFSTHKTQLETRKIIFLKLQLVKSNLQLLILFLTIKIDLELVKLLCNS